MKLFHRPDRSCWWNSLSGYKQEITCSLTVIFSDFSYLISTHAIPLFTLYESGENEATVYARNILIASGLLDYDEPINLKDSVKSAIISKTDYRKKLFDDMDSKVLKLFPNPASAYFIAEINMQEFDNNSQIYLRNSNGLIVRKEVLSKAHEQVLIETNGLPQGTYFVTIEANWKPVCTKTITIVN